VNFTDCYQREGRDWSRPLPIGQGNEGAGTVVGVGPGVGGFAAGDRVAWLLGLGFWATGSYATHALVSSDRLVALPREVTTETAASALLQGITAQYLSRAVYPLEPGRVCVVHAAGGGVGLLLTQVAKLRGARVIAVASTEQKAAAARAVGADDVIVGTGGDFVATVRRLSGGEGVDVVYDGVGKDTFDVSLACLRPRGMLVLYGMASGAVPPFDLARLAPKALFLTRPGLSRYLVDRAEFLERSGEVLGWLREGRLVVRIAKRYPLRDVPQAHRDLEGRGVIGKLVIETA
jgi:NADPH2:quinone reductase